MWFSSSSNARATLVIALGAHAALTSSVAAQQRSGSIDGITVSDVAPGAAQLLAPPPMRAAAAAVGVRESGSTFRGSVVPSELFDHSYEPIWSELQLSVLTDTSPAQSLPRTDVVLSTMFVNPLNLRANRAVDAARICDLSFPCADLDELTRAPGTAEDYRTMVESLQAEYATCDLTGDDPDTCVPNDPELAAIANDAASLCRWTEHTPEQAACVTSARESLRAHQVRECVARRAETRADSLMQCRADLLAHAQAECATRAASCQVDRLWGWEPSVRLLFGVSIYPVGTTFNDADATKTGQIQSFGGASAQLEWASRPTLETSVRVWIGREYSRPSGLPHAVLTSYLLGGVEIAGLVAPFLSAPDLRASEAYSQSGFVPGLSIGVAGQFRSCIDATSANCRDGVTSAITVTPFIDVRVSAEIQLRAGAVVSYQSLTSASVASEWSAGPVLSASGSLSAPRPGSSP